MRKILAVAILSLFIAGCSGVGNSPTASALSVITTSTNLYYHYENGEVVNFIDQVELTELELIVVIEALDQAERSKSVLTYYKDSPLSLIEDIGKITFQYAKIKSSYLSVRNVVGAHWDEYPEESRQVFLVFDDYSSKLDKEFEKLLGDIKTNEAIMVALSLAETGLKLAALL